MDDAGAVNVEGNCLHPDSEGDAADCCPGPARMSTEDRLSFLPLDILLHVCCMVSAMDLPRHADSDRHDLPYPPSVSGDAVAYTGHALRSCCKRLRSASDATRISISFSAGKQTRAIPYMRKLPCLNTVSITYNKRSHNVSRSLTLLRKLLPNLTSLTLKYKSEATPTPPGAEDITGEAKMDALLLQWSGSLLHLELDNFKCVPSGGADGSGLRFLSQLPALQALKLRLVSPTLVTEDIAGCTGLLKLSLLKCAVQAWQGNTLDLSPLSSLQEICCQEYALTELKTTGLTALWQLECDWNRLRALDVSTCTSLRRLTCSSNCLKSVDLTARSSPDMLHCRTNLSTDLGMATCPMLQVLDCSCNPLSDLRVTSCPLLTELSCGGYGSPVTELDLSSCTSLQSLRCSLEFVGTLDLQACPKLRELYVSGCNNLLVLSLAGLEQLQEVDATRSSLVSLDVTGCTALTTLCCGGSKALATLSVSGRSRMETLELEGCPVTCLDLASSVKLQSLNFKSCPVEFLDLSACVSLTEVLCRESNIRSLDVSASAATLTKLSCDRCPLMEVLSVTGCRKLVTMWCAYCPILRELSCEGCGRLAQFFSKGSGRFDGETIASLQAAQGKRVGEHIYRR